MKHSCDHVSKCESCHEAMRKLKVEASVKNELRAEIAEKLGVSHLKGTPQLDAAKARLDQLLLIERIAIAAEREGLRAASVEATAN
jgi:hypothetical protein